MVCLNFDFFLGSSSSGVLGSGLSVTWISGDVDVFEKDVFVFDEDIMDMDVDRDEFVELVE